MSAQAMATTSQPSFSRPLITCRRMANWKRLRAYQLTDHEESAAVHPAES
jgi:hypothetical protein